MLNDKTYGIYDNRKTAQMTSDYWIMASPANSSNDKSKVGVNISVASASIALLSNYSTDNTAMVRPIIAIDAEVFNSKYTLLNQ